MPKGRGSNQRRRSLRQKTANLMARINQAGVADSVYEKWRTDRARRMHGAFNPAKRVPGRHPLERR